MDIGGREGVWNAVIRMISWMEYSDDYFFYSMEFILNNGRANLQQLLLVNTCDNNILLLDQAYRFIHNVISTFPSQSHSLVVISV